MKWEKLGQIFQPQQHKLPDNCLEFAQSPQALVLDDRVRIYFYTRSREPNGKFLSHIAFVDFDKAMNRILGVADRPVIALGALGCFDEHGIFPMNVVRNDACVYGFTCGWSRRISVSVETAIGLTISHNNGLTFDRLGAGPVISSSVYEPVLVGDPFVVVKDGTWHMWYIFGTKWIAGGRSDPSPARVYKIAYATGSDPIHWSRDNRQIIADRLNSDECQALPTVVQIDNRFHMYFCYREATDFRTNPRRGYRLGYAFSDDLRNWTRDDERAGISFSSDGWDSTMMCYPHLFKCDNTIYLLYNGNEFGRYGFGLARLKN